MGEQELKNIWKTSSKTEDILIDINKLMNNFKYKMENRERIVRRRDLRETIAAIIAVALYTAVVIKIPFSVSSIGAFLMILSMINIVVRLYNKRKSKFTQNLFSPIKEQFIQQKTFMLGQAKLLRNVHWLFLPLFISYMIFEWGDFAINTVDNSLVEFMLVKKPIAKIITTILMVIFCIYAIIQNKRAAKVNWEPLIKDIDAIIKNLDKEK